MTDIELRLERTVSAPIEAVFARLVDIPGYAEWMPSKGSILKRTRVTSDGPPGVGTTYVDETSQGTMPGDIAEYEEPNRVVFHWWDARRPEQPRYEGWPGYDLERIDDRTTRVVHHARLRVNGVYRLAAPVFRLLAVRERTATIDALAASFEQPG